MNQGDTTMKQPKFWEALFVVLSLILGALLIFAPGCDAAAGVKSPFWGTPATYRTDANGATTVVSPAVPGFFTTGYEGLALLVSAVGLPALGFWIRSVGKKTQDAHDRIDEATTPPPGTP